MSKWTKWKSGNMPVSAETEVEVKFKDGSFGYGQAKNFDWRNTIDIIVSYRVIKG